MHRCNVVKMQQRAKMECGTLPQVLHLTHMGNLALFRRVGPEWSVSVYQGRNLVASATGPLCFLRDCRVWLESDDVARRRRLLAHLAFAYQQPANSNA